MEKITIRKLRIYDDEIDPVLVFCYVLGLENKSVEIMKIIAKKMKQKDKVSLDELSKELNLPKTTVSHHIKKFEMMGIIRRMGRYYFFREHSLSRLVDEIERDIISELNKLKKILKELEY